MSTSPRSHTGKCKSFIDCLAIDPSEAPCVIHYQWHRGERETTTSPALPEQIEILRVVVGGENVYYTHQDHDGCMAVWVQSIWENVALWKDWTDGEREAADARRHKVRIEMRRGD